MNQDQLSGLGCDEPVKLPTIILPSPVDASNEKISKLLERAAERTQPHGFRRWFRFLSSRSRSHDKLLREILSVLTKTNARLANRVNHLVACIDCQMSMISRITEVRNADAQIIAAFVKLSRSFKADMISRVTRLEDQADVLAGQLSECQKELSAILAFDEKLSSSLAIITERITGIGEEVTQLHAGAELQKDHLESRIGLLAEQIVGWESNLRESVASLHEADEEITFAHAAAKSRTRDIVVHLTQLQAQADRLQIQVAGIDAKMRSDAGLLETVVQEKDLEEATIEVIQRRLDKLSAHLLRVEFDSQIPVTPQ